MKNLSIIQRIAWGFGLMIALLLLIILAAWFSGQQMAAQVNVLAGRIAPTLVQSRAVTRDLFFEDKVLRNLLAESEPEVLERDKAQLAQWQTAFEADLAKLKDFIGDDSELQDQLTGLAEQQQVYWQLASDLLSSYGDNLASQKALASKAGLTQDGKRFASELALMVAPLGAHYTVALSRNLTNNLELMLSNTQEALADQDPVRVTRRLEANRELLKKLAAQRKELGPALLKQEGAFGGAIQFEAMLGKRLDALLKATCADDGLLGHHLALSQESLAIRNQSEQATRIVDGVLAALGEIDTLVDARLKSRVNDTRHQLTTLEYVLLGGLAIGLLTASLLLWRTISAIRKPLKEILAVQNALCQGNMTGRVGYQKRDEFGQLAQGMNSLTEQMRQMLGEVVGSANELAKVADQNLATLDRTHQQLTQQRGETASVATAMVEMEHTVADVAKAAHHSMESVVEVNGMAQQGRTLSDSNIARINDLAGQLDSSHRVIEQVHGLSVEIGGIVDVISNIAEQTNLLALNAAIESARAGEQGRGFAVVADEVRNLARRTADSTTQIQSMITSLQQSVGQAVTEIAASSSTMQVCIGDSQQTKDTITDISEALHQITDMSSQIAAAAEQQQLTSAEIARNLANINQIAEQNHDEISQVAQTSHQLQDLSGAQQRLVGQFTL